MLAQRGEVDGAISVVRNALSTYPDSDQLRRLLAGTVGDREAYHECISQAWWLLRGGRAREAVRILESGLQRVPRDIQLLELLARAREMSRIEGIIDRAELFLENHSFEAAIEILQRGLSLTPEDDRLHEMLRRAETGRTARIREETEAWKRARLEEERKANEAHERTRRVRASM
jgi:predicted Zn-dependent protease